MKNTSIFVLSILIFAACNHENKQNSTQALAQTAAKETCYQHTKDSSTIRLNIFIKDKMVTGNLTYDYYQKDKSQGTIKGVIKSDTLLADYTFMSEGVESVREVVFLKTVNGWVEGYGEIDDKAGRVFFKDKHKITFDNNAVLKEVPCQ